MQQFFSFLSWPLFTAQHVSGVFPTSSGARWLQCSWSGRPRIQHDCHYDTKVKPEAATAVIELLMMGGKTPETCWAVNKRQDNKLKNCCIWLVIYLNCAMMHGLTNLKFRNWCTIFHREVCIFRLKQSKWRNNLGILNLHQNRRKTRS
jgi:hypothetical protein